MTERLANNRLPNTVLYIREYDDLGLDGEVDVAFLGNLIHDFNNRDGRENAIRFLSEIHKALKPVVFWASSITSATRVRATGAYTAWTRISPGSCWSQQGLSSKPRVRSSPTRRTITA